MLRPPFRACAAVALLFVPAAAAAAGPITNLVPDNAALVIRARQGAARVADFHRSDFWARVVRSPLYSLVRSGPEYRQLRTGLNVLQATTDLDPWDAAAALLGDDACLSLSPRKGKPPGFLVIVRHDDAERVARVEKILRKLHILAGQLVDDQPDPDKTSQIAGITVWPSDNNLLHAFADQMLFICNDRDLLERCLKQRTTAAAAWMQTFDAVPPDACVAAYVNVPRLRQAGAGRGLPRVLPNPLASLLFADWLEHLRGAESAAAWITTDGKTLRLSAQVRRSVPSSQPAAEAAAGLLSIADLPRGMAVLTLHRRFDRWWSDREQRMTPGAVAEFSQFAGVMSTLIPGLDFAEEFLPRVQSAVQLVVARQEFAPDRAPSPVLPAAALIVRLSDAARIGMQLDSGATTALSIINVGAAQQGKPQYLVDVDKYRGHRVTFTQYPPADAPASSMSGDMASASRLDVRYNFSPAITRVGDRLVIATSLPLLHDVVDRLESKKETARPSSDDEFRLDAAEIGRVLHANRDLFISEQMLKNDQPRADAARRVDALLGLADWFDHVTLRALTRPREARLTLEIAVR